MVQIIAEVNGKKIHGLGVLNPLVRLAARCSGKIGKLANKAFGSLTYDMGMSQVFGEYQVYGLKERIERTEAVPIIATALGPLIAHNTKIRF
jgi:hypothetical protein